MSDNPAAPGWYYAAGDPPGTQRYWDGELWQGEPQAVGVPPGAMPQAGGYAHQTYVEQSQATTALVLSILGLLLCGILGPIGWSIANKEIAGIDAGRRDPSNRSTASAARIIGIIVTVLMVLGVVFVILFLGVFAAA